MTQKMGNPAAGDGGVLDCLAGRLDGPDNRQIDRAAVATASVMHTLPCAGGRDDFATGQRLERMVERVHVLGPRPLAELLAEIANATGQPAVVADCIEAYAALDAEIVRAVGADRFPPNVLGVVR